MIFIFGGAFQGKRDFANERFGGKAMPWILWGGEPDVKILYDVEKAVLKYIEEGRNPEEIFLGMMKDVADKILICQDISQGIVPMNSLQRRWREHNGRIMRLLAEESDQVYRIFCGIEQRLK